MRIYLDAAPVIYLVERVPGFHSAVQARITDAGVVMVASDLTRMECRVVPLRNRDTAMVQAFDKYFREAVAEIVPLSAAVVDRATEIRATYGFKTPDALHLTAAILSGCEMFLTNDHRLDRFREIVVEAIT